MTDTAADWTPNNLVNLRCIGDPTTQVMFKTVSNRKPILTIHPDGRVELSPDAKPTEAAAQCLEILGGMMRDTLANERRKALEEAAKVAEWAHMVPPDGGSPTELECEVAREAARQIRALIGETT